MSKEELLEFDGVVTEVLPDGNYRVKLENDHLVLAYMSGRMRKFRIRTGVAISFCDAEERAFLRDIEKLIRMSIPATDRRSDQRHAPHAKEQASSSRPQRGAEPRPHQKRSAAKRSQHHPKRGAHAHQPRGNPPPSPANDGSIESLTFMRQPSRAARPHSGHHGARRAPRQQHQH